MNDNKATNIENQTALYDLIQSIQSKIDVKDVKNDDTSEKINMNENISNNLNQSENIEQNSTVNKENIDFSSLLSNIDISSILGMFNSNKNTTDDSFNFNNIDPNTLLKIQRIVSNFNKNDPKKDLLKSLKPFLRKSRQDKIGEYINILSLVNAIDIFGSKGSD